MQIDHKLYDYYYREYGDRNDKQTREKLTALVAKEIQGINAVYKDTNFDGITGISFTVKNLQITSEKETSGYPYKDENVEVNDFLAINAKQDHGDYCLGYVMTYRDFAGGTLGLAYVGGVGSKYQESATQKSQNAGIVTYLNHGSPVLERISYLTLAHEIGHNFGTGHDEDGECMGGDGGQYIMYYAATSGDEPNNRKFSDCSIKKMTAKLKAVMSVQPGDSKGSYVNNFVDSDEPMC
ncbi:hypothetical protein PMAYCL1PPCAC_24112 [Pristionchus mayeri]|uniref:Peptidase M12B domain-containing protein n=1 Tax=Pristionchus mayeri TaxID=1317129 RepID=A0AAN5D1E6_9BILA|nr:hypothetical protein PMAYCL1PPCAC_24112 [Pristionchus mayeri]